VSLTYEQVAERIGWKYDRANGTLCTGDGRPVMLVTQAFEEAVDALTLRYSDELPTQEGWWWYRMSPSCEGAPYLITERKGTMSGDLIMVENIDGNEEDVRNWRDQWAGPIPTPEPTDEA
jgi:hypothetical protein